VPDLALGEDEVEEGEAKVPGEDEEVLEESVEWCDEEHFGEKAGFRTQTTLLVLTGYSFVWRTGNEHEDKLLTREPA
jgi:hypothetical protein